MATTDSRKSHQPFHWQYNQLDDQDFKLRGHSFVVLFILLSVFLLFCLLFFYLRWLCRYHSHLFSTDTSSGGPHAPPPERSQGLHPACIKALPVTLYNPSFAAPAEVSYDSECCICLGGFQEGEKVKRLPKCSHCFHGDCVDKWLVAQTSCPVCRASVADDPVAVVVSPAVEEF